MIVAVAFEFKLDRTPDGAVWTRLAHGHEAWRRYLETFDAVKVIARVRAVERVPEGARRVDGPGVTVHALPAPGDPWAAARDYLRLRQALDRAVAHGDAAILRAGSPIADLLQPRLRRSRHPYGIELVGDPWEVLAPGAIRHPLRAYFRRQYSARLKTQCAEASAVLYASDGAVRERYPARAPAFDSAGAAAFHRELRERTEAWLREPI